MHIHINTVREAAHHWVGGFNAVSEAMFKRAYAQDGLDHLEVLASPMNECSYCGADVQVGESECESCGSDEVYTKRDLPMWGTLWSFGEWLDEDWCRENAKLVASCGFMVYETADDDIFLGIDGAGYDFYEAHWVPLYKARGLKWHDTEEEE